MSAPDNKSVFSFESQQASKQAEPLPFRDRLAELPLASQPASARTPDFDAVVAPLEALADEHGAKRLNGPGLEWCLAAYEENREGFAVCASRVLARWDQGKSRQPLGLLCRMVRDGEHKSERAHSRLESAVDIPL